MFALPRAQPCIPPWIGRTTEPDLVPRPRVGVEGAEPTAHDDAPRSADGNLPIQVALREGLDDLMLRIGAGIIKPIDRPTLSSGLIEVRGHLLPGLGIRWHVVVPVAVELSAVELGVDHLEYRNPWVGVLACHDVAEGPQRSLLTGR